MRQRLACLTAMVLGLSQHSAMAQQPSNALTDALVAQAKARAGPPLKISGLQIVGPKYDGNFEALIDANPPREVPLERQAMTIES
jgi:hypothetical protein